jgi:hypothetical protein
MRNKGFMRISFPAIFDYLNIRRPKAQVSISGEEDFLYYLRFFGAARIN